MPVMEITFSPLDQGIRGNGDLVTSCILLSKQNGVKCELRETKIIVEGDKEILLGILHELDHISFSMGDQNIAISLKIDEGRSTTIRPYSI